MERRQRNDSQRVRGCYLTDGPFDDFSPSYTSVRQEKIPKPQEMSMRAVEIEMKGSGIAPLAFLSRALLAVLSLGGYWHVW